MTPKDCAVRCAACGYHAVTSSEEASQDDMFLMVAAQVISAHTKKTGHNRWIFGADVERELPA